MKIVKKINITRVSSPRKSARRITSLKIGASTRKKLNDNTQSRRTQVKRKLEATGGFESNIKKMVTRTFDTIETFLKHACNNPSPSLWTRQPMKSQAALLTGLNDFNIDWARIKLGCKWYMKIDNILTATAQQKAKLKREIFLTIAGLIQNILIIKPYAGHGDEGSVAALTFDPNAAHANANRAHFELFLENFKSNIFTGTNVREKDAIHIQEGNITNRPSTNAVISLIHEASHKFAGTDDHGYLYSKDEGASQMKGLLASGKYMSRSGRNQIRLEPDNDFDGEAANHLIWNADSVAALIYHYGS